MNSILQTVLIVASLLFFLFIFSMVFRKKLELKYALIWLFTAFCLVILSIFPKLVILISELLHIVEPVNTIFLLIIFFLLLIVFSLTISLSRNSDRVKKITQAMALMKEEQENNSKEQDKK